MAAGFHKVHTKLPAIQCEGRIICTIYGHDLIPFTFCKIVSKINVSLTQNVTRTKPDSSTILEDFND